MSSPVSFPSHLMSSPTLFTAWGQHWDNIGDNIGDNIKDNIGNDIRDYIRDDIMHRDDIGTTSGITTHSFA